MTVSEPPRVPAVTGVKVTFMVQLNPAARLTPQSFVCANSALATMLAMLSGPLPVLLNVTGSAALVVPVTWLPKVSEAGDKIAIGATPTPLSATD